MSTTVDQRVVEMRFDNQNFEKNVSNTMSTLDKLKQKLNLTGASKGLQEVDSAAKKVNMSGLGSSVEAVSAKFSAMQVIGTTALVNITNQAMATGKKMISALTIDPIKTGFSEYETQINAVQTILANTSSKGTTIDQVNEALEELNKYADKTIYNFTEMTRNIGTFTAAGVDLDTSVSAIQGIANLAAVSGSTSQQASTAMYQLSQALATGKVKLQDWNSVVNAGMGGEVFQNALKRTATAMGTNVDALIEKYGSFRDSLTQGEWLTTEVLTETLNQFTMAAEKGSKEWETYKKSLLDKGYSEEQANEILNMANTATDAATKVKTFTQLWDVMKESAQSGWSQTWKLIIGDFEEAKALLTPLADFFTNAINKMSDARNKLLEGALGKSFKGLVDKVRNVVDPIKKSADSIKNVVKSVEEYAAVVDDIIGGNWGNGQERWDKLAAAGYDWAHAQNLVNEKLGSSVRHSTDYKEAAEGAAEATEKAAEATGKLSKEEMARIDLHARLATKKDAEYMKEVYGYTKDQTEALRELAYTADKLGMPVKELLENIDEIDGRWLLMNSFKNIGMSIVNVFKAIAKAYREIFPPMQSDTLFNIIAGFYKFTRSLEVNSDTAEKITRTFKGLFAIIDIITTIVGGGLKIAFKLVSSILGYFHLDILDVTAAIGDALVKFRDWVDSLFDVSGVLDVLVPILSSGAKAIKEWFTAFKNSEGFQNYISGIVEAFQDLKNLDFRSIGSNIVEGFSIGIGEGIKRVISNIISIGKEIIDVFCAILGIHSPSTVFMAIGGFIIAGLILGIKEGLISVPGALQGIVDKCVGIFQAIDWSTLFAVGITAASLLFIKKITDAISAIAAPFEGLGEIFEATADAVKSFGKIGKAAANNLNAKALRSLVGTIGILAAIVVGLMYFFTKCDVSVGAIIGASVMVIALAGVLVAMAWAMGQISDASIEIDKNGIGVKGLKNSLLPLAASILIVAAAVKLMSTIDPVNSILSFLAVAAIMAAMLVFLKVCQTITGGSYGSDIDKIGSLMTRLSIAMLLMIAVVKLAGKLTLDEMKNGALFAVGFTAFVAAITGISRIIGEKKVKKFGGMLIKLAVALALLVGVCKLVDMLSIGEAVKGALFAAAFVVFMRFLAKAVTINNGTQIAKLGGLLLAVSISMALMVGVCKLAGTLSLKDMLKGTAFAIAFVAFVKALVWATKVDDGTKLAKVGFMLFSIAAAIAILAVVTIALSLMSWEGIVKGIVGVGLLSKFMIAVIKSTEKARIVNKNLIAMAIAIGVMGLVVAGLAYVTKHAGWKNVGVAVAAIGILMGMFAVMSLAASKLDKGLGVLIVMTVAIGVMATALAVLSHLDVKSSLTNAAALALLIGVMAGALFIMSKMGSKLNAVTGIGMLLLMLIPMFAFVGMLKELDGVQTSIRNTLILTGLMAAMTGLLVVLGLAKGLVSKAFPGIVGLTAMAIPMVAFIEILKRIPSGDICIKNVLVLTGVMLAMTGLLALLGLIGGFGWTALIGVGLLTAMVVPMGAFIAMLAWMQNIDGAATNAAAITKLMTVMTGLLAVLGIIGAIVIGTGGIAAGAIGIGLLALTAMVIPMATFIAMLAWMQNIQNAETNANLIIGLLTVMTGLLTHLAIIGPFALIGVAALAGLTLLIGAIGGLVVALGALDTLTDGGLQKLIDSGLPLLIKLAEGLGTMIGKFAGGMIEGVADSIVVLMKSLKEASEYASGIEAGSFDGVKELLGVLGELGKTMVGTQFADIFVLGGDSIDKFKEDGSKFFGALSDISKEMVAFALPEGFSVDNVLSLLDMLKTISSYSIGSTWKDWFFLGSADSIEIFKEDGKAFFGALSDISKEMVAFSLPEGFSIDGLTSLMDALKAVGSYTMGESWKQAFSWFGTQDSMENFKTDGVNFFKAIKEISKEMVGFTFSEDFSVDGFSTLLDVLKRVGTTTVGLTFSDIFSGGGTSMEKFQSDGIAFFGAVKAISDEMVGFSFPKNFSAEGLTTLLDIFKSIGNYTMGESWKQAFSWFGTQDSMTNFQSDGVNFFKAIKDISSEAEGVSSAPFMVAKNAIARLKEIIDSVKDIDYSGVSKFTGIGTGGLGADGPAYDIARALVTFGNEVALIDTANMSKAITAAANIRTVISNLAGLDTSGVSEFKKAVDELGTVSFDGFVKAFSTSIPKVTNIGNSLVDSLISGIRSKQAALASAGSALIDGIVSGIRSKQIIAMSFINSLINTMTDSIRNRVTLFNQTGVFLMTGLITGMTSKNTLIVTAVITPIAGAINTARLYYSSFYSAGSYLVDGFAAGISANSYKAAAKASAMASAAAQAAQEALGINSPSKVFYGIGNFSGLGFINALGDYASKAYNAGSNMADSARSGLSDAISKVRDVLNGEADMQPTIRPVLDLSDVRAGASTIGNMFGSSVGVMANVGAINSMMNENQNGGNGDIVSAINALRKDLGNVGGTTYSINGITYDDGSNISDAVKSLVRAAKVERRI